MSPADAWERLKVAAGSIGTVEETHDSARYLVAKARYGLNPVRLRVAVVTGAAGQAVLDITGRGQDIMGGASRKVIDRLISAI